MISRKEQLILAAGFFIAVILFARVIGFDFVLWDDPVLVSDNRLLTMAFVPAIKMMFGHFIHGDYLPITQLFNWCLAFFFGVKPAAFHFFGLLLHLLNTAFLWRLLRMFNIENFVRYLMLVLFVFHPVQVESVAWVSEMKGLLASFFLLLSALFYFRAKRFSPMALGFFVLSLLSKGVGVFVPFFIFLIEGLNQKRWRESLFRLLPYLMISVVYALVRMQAYSQNISISSISWPASYWLMLPLLWGAALLSFAKMIFWPFEQNIIYPFPELVWWHGVVLFIAVAVIAFCLIKGNSLQREAILLSMALLLPVMHVFPRINFVNERYLYLLVPLVVLMLPLKQLQSFSEQKVPIWRGGILTVLTLMLAGITYLRLDVWQNSKSLWQRTYEQLPGHPMVINNLGVVMQEEKNWTQAVTLFEQSLKLDHSGQYAHLALNNLGIIFSNKESDLLDFSKSEKYFLQAAKQSLRPIERVQSQFNLALLYRQQGDKEKYRNLLIELGEFAQKNNDSHVRSFLPKIGGLLQELNKN